jgi:hypothetical protein
MPALNFRIFHNGYFNGTITKGDLLVSLEDQTHLVVTPRRSRSATLAAPATKMVVLRYQDGTSNSGKE